MIAGNRSNQRDIRVWNKLQHSTWAKPNRYAATGAVLGLLSAVLAVLAVFYAGEALWGMVS